MYYPGVVYQQERSILPSMSEYTTNKVKHEYSASSYQLPSLSSYDGLPSRCGRFDGFPESKGYFPNTMMQQELNMT
jgi:meiosis-specific transcription factor NDT80